MILPQNEYNNSVTPIYFDGDEGTAIGGGTRYFFISAGHSGYLEIDGDAFDVFLIIERICLAKGKYESVILADMNDMAVGDLPGRAQRLVKEWAGFYQKELLE